MTTLETTSTQSGPLPERLKQFIDSIPAIDCHDHLLAREKVLESGDALFHLLANTCLPPVAASAGIALPSPPYDPGKSWEVLRPHMADMAGIAAYRSLVAASKLLYDFDRFPLDEAGYGELRDRMETAYRQEDWYVQALRDKANVDAAILASLDSASAPLEPFDLFLPVANLDDFLLAYSYEHKLRLERRFHVRLQDLQDLIDLIAEVLATCADEGTPAFWLSFSTFRSLMVGGASQIEAARIYGKPEHEISPEEARHFQDFVIHFIAERCASIGVPLQIDTGAGDDALSIERSDPCQATGLVAEHLGTRIVFLHGGLPFSRHLGALAKTFPNIYVDAGSLATHSVSLLGEILAEWIELLPVAKILLWSGNGVRIENTIGSLLLTREVLTEILVERVESGLFSEELAFDLARKLLRDVPRRLYRTDEMRVRRQTAMEL